MTEPAENTNPPAAPAKRKYTRRKRHKATGKKVIPLKMSDEFAGMTATDCCTDCAADCCVISGTNVCSHPLKGGQIPPNDSAAFARFLRAKKALSHLKIDKS
jgi:hypothetical protein